MSRGEGIFDAPDCRSAMDGVFERRYPLSTKLCFGFFPMTTQVRRSEAGFAVIERMSLDANFSAPIVVCS